VADQRDEPDSTWQPLTSEPGEIYTVEGRIRGVGAFASGLKHRSPRSSEYRHSMARVALTVLGIGVAVAAVAILLF
jgi:hypothetical protein